ncbi:MAG: MaoC family dehydratase [Actinobacteria bacterium]|nr:MaoC family dehydratase [Actinomycetota bacterium]
MGTQGHGYVGGPLFEDFSVGQRILHSGRTITQADNIWFTLLTCNNNPLHIDERYAAGTEFGRLVINSALTIALATGLTVNEFSRNGINLGWENVRLPNPLFPGDTLWCETFILECRTSRSKPEMGIVTGRTIGRNQADLVVISFERSILVYRKPGVPDIASRVSEEDSDQFGSE